MMKALGCFLMIELISPCMFDLNMVSCIVCLHTTFEMVQIDSSDDRRDDVQFHMTIAFNKNVQF